MLERAETAGVFFHCNIAMNQQNAALQFLMYLPTSISENWTIILIFFSSKSKQTLCASNLTNTFPRWKQLFGQTNIAIK